MHKKAVVKPAEVDASNEIYSGEEIKNQISILRQQSVQAQPQSGETITWISSGSIKTSKTKQETAKSLTNMSWPTETERLESRSSQPKCRLFYV